MRSWYLCRLFDPFIFLLNIDSEKNSLLNNMFNTINASPNSTYYKIKNLIISPSMITEFNNRSSSNIIPIKPVRK